MQVKKAGRLKFRVNITFKRLIQQDGVESLQSDRESLKEKSCLPIIGRQLKVINCNVASG